MKADNPENLTFIPIAKIQPNEHNPRLIFRPDEIQELAESIQEIDVQVPISVFRDGAKYTLIDGERRWRACKLLNKDSIPAIIYPKPSPVQNLVYMFNIHKFRKDWDPLPTAMKLEELKELYFQEEGEYPTESKLSALTGMSRGAIRRCKLIMEIPKGYRDQVLKELEKPEPDRRITTDLFVETQRSVRTITGQFPKQKDLERRVRAAVVEKYKKKIIPNVVHMRLIAKIARAHEKGAAQSAVIDALERLAEDATCSAEDAYRSIAWVYDLRSAENQAKAMLEAVRALSAASLRRDAVIVGMLEQLKSEIAGLLASMDGDE
jgi:ParB/RepB/Spo0J family partition protein